MNKNMKLFAGILVFGSLWGFSECIIGSVLKDAGLPYGSIMTGVFVLTYLVLSRMYVSSTRYATWYGCGSRNS